jgi:carbon monoxide dehydrogenase subunit G
MSEVRSTVQIDAPPERVWAFVMDPHNFDDWVTIHRRVEKADPGPPREGMKIEQILCLRHTNFKVKWTLAEVEPQRVARWEGKGPMGSSAKTCYILEPNGNGGTRFDYVNEFKAPGGPLGAAASRVVVGGVPEREAAASLARLKQVLEAG